MAIDTVADKYELVICDCDAAMVCPQSKSGSSPRCKIYKKKIKEKPEIEFTIGEISLRTSGDPHSMALEAITVCNGAEVVRKISLKKSIRWLRLIGEHLDACFG